MKMQAIFNLIKLLSKNILEVLVSKPLSLLNKSSWGRDILFSALPENELVLCNTIDGCRYIVNSSDQTIGRDVYRSKKSFDSQNLERSLQLLGVQKSMLLDVGANIGTIGIYAVSQGLVEKCIAFEPEPRNFNLLRANVQLNQLSDQFELHNLALAGDDLGELLFELSPSNFGDHRVSISKKPGLNNEQSREKIMVRTDSLDRLVCKTDLDGCILFMDTQGFEGHILSGARNLINHGVPIVTEFCPYLLARSQGLDKFYSALEHGPYSTIYDLNNNDIKMDFSLKTLHEITDQLGDDDGRFTDLLIF